MKSTQVKVKTVKPKGELMEMAQSLNQIFAPSDQNRHMYIFKILKQFKEHNNLFGVLLQCDKTLFKGKYLSDLRKTHSEADLQILEQIRQLEQDVGKYMNLSTLNTTEIMINVQKLNQQLISLSNLEKMNSYLQGVSPNTLPQILTSNIADLSRYFSDIQSLTIPQFRQTIISKLGDSHLYLLNMPLHTYLSDLVLDDAKSDNDYEIVKVCLMLIFAAQKKRYKSLNIPEFEVSNIKEMVKQAIAEFKKQLRGCDEAFKQLLKSLDTFTDNFDQYYEQFQLNGKEPSILFVNFIDDVAKQYQDSDQQSSKVILSQFRRIQKEFGKKLGTQINNPQIQQLYSQLEKQITKAQNLMGMADVSDEEQEESKE